MEIFGSQERDQGTEAAKEAITEDMTMAMMNYMPLRGAFSFGTGISAEEAEALLKKLNGETRGSGRAGAAAARAPFRSTSIFAW